MAPTMTSLPMEILEIPLMREPIPSIAACSTEAPKCWIPCSRCVPCWDTPNETIPPTTTVPVVVIIRCKSALKQNKLVISQTVAKDLATQYMHKLAIQCKHYGPYSASITRTG